MKVWIVTETIGMTLEGDTEIRGVYASEEAAKAAEAALGGRKGHWPDDLGVGEYEVQEDFHAERIEQSAWD